jgi:hypothetical protein
MRSLGPLASTHHVARIQDLDIGKALMALDEAGQLAVNPPVLLRCAVEAVLAVPLQRRGPPAAKSFREAIMLVSGSQL